MIRVTLVGVTHDWRYDTGRRDVTLAPPLLKAYADAQPELAGKTSIRTADHQVRADSNESLESAASAILENDPDLVGLSCYIWNITAVLGLCRVLKSRSPRLKIVLGGPEVAPRGEALLYENEDLDFISYGDEGEKTFVELLSRLHAGQSVSGVRGLVWRDGRKVVREPEMPLLEDLSLLPSPYLNGAIALRDGDTIVIESSRGCPYNCKYCDWPRGRPRNFPVSRMIAELESAQKQAKNLMVFFGDADFFTDLPRAKEILKGMMRLSENSSDMYFVPGYLARLDDESFELMNRENFCLGAGVQSINPVVLKNVARFFHKTKVEKGVETWRRLSPRCRLSFHLIYGLPGESIESFRAGIQWALDQRVSSVWFFRNYILPGAELGKNMETFGLVAEAAPPYRVVSTTSATAEEIEAFSRWACCFRILYYSPVAEVVDSLAQKLDVKSLVIWDEIIEKAASVPEFGLASAYADADPLDNGYSLASTRWMAKAQETGMFDKLRQFSLDFADEKLIAVGWTPEVSASRGAATSEAV